MSIISKKRSFSFIALGIGVFITGVSAVLIKSANAPGVVTAFYRMVIGSAVLIVPFLVSRFYKPQPLPAKGIFFAMLAGLFFAIDMSMWATGIVASNATLPTLAANLAPVWVAIGAIWLFRERPRRGFWIGLAIATMGIAVMVGNDLVSSTGMLKGIALGLGAGLFYGMYYLAAQNGRAIISTMSFLSISTFTSAATLGIIALLTDNSFTGYDKQTWLIFLAYGIGVQAIGWWLINFAQGYLRATVVAPTLLGQPVVTCIVAYWVLDEQHSVLHLAGGAIVMAGIYVVHLTRTKN